MEKRIENYNILKQQFSTLNPCLTEANDKLILSGYKHPIVFDKQIGSPSAYGIVYMAHTEEEGGRNPIYFSAKLMSADTESNQNEVSVLKMLTESVQKYGIVNFPIMYTSLNCTSNSICKTDKCPTITKNNYFVVLNELADGDTHWWFQQTYQDKVYRSVILQMIYAIYIFHKMGFLHNDKHLGNFLIHKIKPGHAFTYRLNGENITVPNYGYLLVLWDFGLSSQFESGDPWDGDYDRPLGLISNIDKYDIYVNYYRMKALPHITRKWLFKIRLYIMSNKNKSEDSVIARLFQM